MSMFSILSANQSLMKMQTVQSSNTKMQGQINVLTSEIETDGVHATENKKKAVKEMEEKATQNMNNLMSELTDINEKLKPSEPEKEKTELEKEPKTDKVELSSNWKEKTNGGETVVEGKAVTYKPEGNTIKVTPQISDNQTATSQQSESEEM